MNSRAYVSQFNFGGGDQEKKVGSLSGGEKNRVYLAMTLKQGANLLLLDEPSNDLDDQWFLDRLAIHILAFESDSEVV